MFYVLGNDVFLVNGFVKSCIYDFSKSKLYSINKALAEKIQQAIKGECTPESVDGELNKIFAYLMDIGVLTVSDKPKIMNIQDIQSDKNHCSFAWIEITEKCNLRCQHCYNESDANRNSSMTVSDYKMVVDSLQKLKIDKIQIIGGEPFLFPKELREMLDYSIGKFEGIEIFTNGTLISDSWMNYLKDTKIKVALSVYSYNSKTHDKVTKCKGSWEKTNNTIRILNNYGIKYRVCNTLMKDVELGEPVTDLYNLSQKKDIVRMTGRADFSLLSDELIRKKLITKSTFSHPLSKEFTCTTVCGHNCFNSKIYIAANLDVYPCVMERRIKHCNIRKHGGIKLQQYICEMNKDCINECHYCEYRYTCFDCRPNSLSGELLEKPWYCTYNPLLGKWDDEDEFISELKKKWV